MTRPQRLSSIHHCLTQVKHSLKATALMGALVLLAACGGETSEPVTTSPTTPTTPTTGSVVTPAPVSGLITSPFGVYSQISSGYDNLKVTPTVNNLGLYSYIRSRPNQDISLRLGYYLSGLGPYTSMASVFYRYDPQYSFLDANAGIPRIVLARESGGTDTLSWGYSTSQNSLEIDGAMIPALTKALGHQTALSLTDTQGQFTLNTLEENRSYTLTWDMTSGLIDAIDTNGCRYTGEFIPSYYQADSHAIAFSMDVSGCQRTIENGEYEGVMSFMIFDNTIIGMSLAYGNGDVAFIVDLEKN